MEALKVEHELANDYYYNQLNDKKRFMHLVGCDKFCCYLYYNGSYINPVV